MSPVVIAPAKPTALVPTIAAASVRTIVGLLRTKNAIDEANNRTNTFPSPTAVAPVAGKVCSRRQCLTARHGSQHLGFFHGGCQSAKQSPYRRSCPRRRALHDAGCRLQRRRLPAAAHRCRAFVDR